MSERAVSTSLEAPETEYGESYFSNYWGGGGAYERNERWLSFFGTVADGLVRDFHPSSAIDAGCAMGFLVEALHDRGVDVRGVDISEYAISQVHPSVADRCSVGSLTEPLPGRYDLLTCIEVLEHLPPTETEAAIANLCAASDTLVISSTPGDYGEPTHLNVQPPEAWAAHFAKHGFVRDLDRDLSYISPWASVYVRRDQSLEDTVRDYDRSWWRLRREVGEVRASLLKSQERLSELEAGGGVGSRPELLAELDRRDEEILRLRDRMIGMESELGAAKGKVVEYEDHAKRLSNAKLRIEERIPVIGKLAGKLWTILRGRR
ncbi:MAG TPA: methyltransferase domain-containing protein [Solirubrobacterales bacterium]|jgi:SAM-dependent methyltransferase|nr:methyltransferase domain-containing protein [Solirubrobacterales bacterium]